jgi:hypothetical protein
VHEQDACPVFVTGAQDQATKSKPNFNAHFHLIEALETFGKPPELKISIAGEHYFLNHERIIKN